MSDVIYSNVQSKPSCYCRWTWVDEGGMYGWYGDNFCSGCVDETTIFCDQPSFDGTVGQTADTNCRA